MAGNNFFVPTKQLWAARQASPGRPGKKLVPISSEKLQIEAKSQILTFNDFFKNFSEGVEISGRENGPRRGRRVIQWVEPEWMREGGAEHSESLVSQRSVQSHKCL